jgi:hypothetical protein
MISHYEHPPWMLFSKTALAAAQHHFIAYEIFGRSANSQKILRRFTP